MVRVLRVGVIVGVVVLGLGACSEVRNLVDDAASAALRTTASQALKQAAEQQNQPLKADPVCTGEVKTNESSVDISCTAETQAGLPVSGKAVVQNLGNDKTCKATLTIKIGTAAPITQDFPGCTK